MQKLAKIISVDENNTILEEMKQDEVFIADLKKLEDLSLEYVTKYGKTKIYSER